MNRRKFLAGSAATLTGSGLLVGTQSASRVESQRTVQVQVEDDEDAYLYISYPESVDIDCDREITITLQNQAKEDFTNLDIGYRVHGDDISVGSVTEPNSIGLGSTAEIKIPVSCNSNSTEPDGTFEFDITAWGASSRIETAGNGRKIELDCTGTGCLNSPEDDPCSDSTLTGISFIAFCGGGTNLNPNIDQICFNEDGVPIEVGWSASASVDEVVLQGGREWYRYDVSGANSGTAKMDSSDADEFKHASNFDLPGGDNQVKFSGDTGRRCPPSPCDKEEGYKINYKENSWTFGSGEGTQETCPQPGGSGGGRQGGGS